MNKINIGSRIKFKNEKQLFTVRAMDERFLVCTKPFNLKKTVIYTIVDLIENIRGTENLVFCMGFESDKDCNEALERLSSGESEISYKNRVELEIEYFIPYYGKN